MSLYLLRHAKALPGYPDAGRELADKGRRHAAELGRYLREKRGFAPAAVWVSPLLRARQTADSLLAAAAVDPPRETVEALEPEADPFPLVERLAAVDGDLLLVGHNPNMERLVSSMISGERTRARLHMKTCVLACLDPAAPGPTACAGRFELRWMFDPRLL